MAQIGQQESTGSISSGTPTLDAEPTGLSVTDERSGRLQSLAGPGTAILRENPALVVLGALFVATAALGRYFSKLDLGASWLHPTEVLLLIALALGIMYVPWREWIARLRVSRALIPLLVLWLFGAVATARGLADWGFGLVLHDVGLVEYSVLILIMAIVVRNRRDLFFMASLIALAGIGTIATASVIQWGPADWSVGSTVLPIKAATGQCIALYVAWIVSRAAAGVRVRPWHYPIAVIGMVVIVLDASRSTWLAMLVAVVALPMLFARSPRRILAAGASAAAVLALGVALSFPADNVRANIDFDFGGSPNPSEIASSAGSSSRQANSGTQTSTAASAPQGNSQGARSGAESQPSAPQGRYYQLPAHQIRSRLHLLSAAGLRNIRTLERRGKARKGILSDIDRRLKQGTPPPPEQSNPESQTQETPVGTQTSTAASAPQGNSQGARSGAESQPSAPQGRYYQLPAHQIKSRLQNLSAPELRRIRALERRGKARKGILSDIDRLLKQGTAPPPEQSSPESQAQETPVVGAIRNSFNSGATENFNAEWRLAFWSYLLHRSVHDPVFGVGFGTPSDFRWQGLLYDGRKGQAWNQQDVTGPHNSFIDMLFRAGAPALLALLALMLLMVIGLVPIAWRAVGESRALAIWLLAGLVITSIEASLNVALEEPFMGIFFWGVLGLGLLAPLLLRASPQSLGSGIVAMDR